MAMTLAQQRAEAEAEASMKAEQAAAGGAPPSSDVTGMGLLKAGGEGLRRGAEAVAGGFGDVANMNAAGASWLAQKLGVSPETAATIGDATKVLIPGGAGAILNRIPGVSGVPSAPTTQQVQAGTDQILPDHHIAANMPEKFAQTATEFLPAAFMGKGHAVSELVKRGILQGIIPGLASEGAGQAVQTYAPQYEPEARIAAALLAGTGGAALDRPAVVPGMDPRSQRTLGKALTGDALDTNSAAARLSELGPTGMLADLGPNMQSLAGAVAATPGQGQGILRTALDARSKGANERINQALDQNLGAAPIPSQVEAGIAANKAVLGPQYEAALKGAAPVDTLGVVAGLEKGILDERGAAQSKLKEVRKMLDVAGTDTLDTSPRTLLSTRHAIDGMLKGETDSNVRRVIGDARAKIDAELQAKVPGIKEVDAQFAEQARQGNAFERGQTVLDSGRNNAIRPQELTAEMATSGLPQGLQVGPSAAPMQLRAGARAEIDRIVGTNANDVVALNRLVKGEGDWNREKLSTLFGADKADRVLKVLDNERVQADTANIVTRNSESARRLATQESLAGGGAGFGVREGYMAGGVLGSARSAGVKLIEKLIGNVGQKRTDASNARLAQALISGNPALIAAIANAKKTTNPMLPGLAAALIAARPPTVAP